MPSAQPVLSAQVSASATVSALVNHAFDNAIAAGQRLLGLPLLVLVVLAVLAGVVALLVLRRLLGVRGHAKTFWLAVMLVVIGLGAATAWVVDQKVVVLEQELRVLRSRTQSDSIALWDLLCERMTKRKAHLFDPVAAETALRQAFGSVKFLPLIYDEATDFASVRLTNPLAHAYVTVVDLTSTNLEIRLGTMVKKKRLTTEFARTNQCTVAINGEAGASPGLDSGFGEWIGNLIAQGQTVLLEDSDRRPFLSFDRQNRPTYSPAKIVDKTPTAVNYNVIWGRWDLLLDGQNVGGASANRQPRTAMAIDQAGRRLYLLVADGRQPGYSLGLSRGEVGKILLALGAHAGMLCDEGGSSCMYLKKFGGLANIPSDNRGKERPTYTHFGIVVR